MAKLTEGAGATLVGVLPASLGWDGAEFWGSAECIMYAEVTGGNRRLLSAEFLREC